MRFRFLFFIFLISISGIFLTGCGYNEGVLQPDQTSFLWFTGNTKDAVVYIDDNTPVDLNESRYVDPSTGENTSSVDKIHYELSPGTHTVVVKRGDTIVVNRTLLLGNGNTREINIP